MAQTRKVSLTVDHHTVIVAGIILGKLNVVFALSSCLFWKPWKEEANITTRSL